MTQNVRGLDSRNKTDIIETLIDKGKILTDEAGSKNKGSKEDYRGWAFKPAD